MYLKDGVNQLAKEAVKTSLDDSIKSELIACLNFAKQEVSKYAMWSELIVPNAEIVIVPDYDSGTATIVKDSRTVLIVGGVVSTDWIGRYINVKSVTYEIIDVSVSANTLTLKSPVIDNSESNLQYAIYKIWYRVPTDIRVVLPDDNYDDMPSPLVLEGYDDYASDYSVGTISVAKDSNVLTGDGTQAFLDNVYSGDLITIEAITYRVKRVVSNNQIIMTNKATTPFSGNYVISSDTPYKGKIGENWSIYGHGSGNDKVLLPYRYIRTLYDMVNDYDTTELSPKFDRAILDIARAEYGRNHPDQSRSWQLDMQVGIGRLQKLELDKDLVWEASQQFRPTIPRGNGRGTR